MRSFSNFTLPPDQTWFLSYRTFAGGGKFFLEQGPDVNTTDGTYFYGGNGDLFAVKRGAGLRTFFDSGGALADGTWYIASLVNSNLSTTAANDIFWSVNGTTRGVTFRTSTLLSGNATNQFNINVRVPSSNYMGEIIVYNRAFSRGEVRLMERYLADKWGISLPTAHPYKTVPSALRPFNPLDISSCSLWLDATDRNTFTFSSGSNISTWADKSGNGNTFTTNFGTPVLTDRVLNNASAVYFNFGTNLNNTTISFGASYSVFILAYQTSFSGTYNRIINGGGSSSDVYLFMGTFNSTSIYSTFTGSGTTWNDINSNTPSTAILQTWGIMGVTNGSSVLTPYFNGAVFSTKTGSSSTFTGLALGAAFSGVTSQTWNGYCAELLVYNKVLTDNERRQVELYLAEKWNLRPSLSTSNAMRLYESLSPVFSPVLFSNCALWLDAADDSTFTFSSGSNISVWRDKSGSNNSATTTAGTPTYSSNRVTLSASRMTTNLSSSVNTETGFVVLNTSGAGDNTIIGASAAGFRSIQISANVIYTLKRDVVVYVTSVNNLPANTTTLLSYDFSSALWMNGAPNGTGSAASFNAGGTTVIGNDSRNFAYSGQVMEIIIYQQTLTGQQRRQVEGYLAWKWGLVGSLPSTHPYKSTPV
jgi:hypothetical protein